MSDSGSNNAERPAEFQPIETAAESRKLLYEGAKTMAQAMVWTKNQEILYNTHLTEVSKEFITFHAWVPKEFSQEKLMDVLATNKSDELYFNVSLQRANIFFKARFLGLEETGLKFKAPEKLFKVQRRKDMRFPIPDGYVLRVDFDDPLFPSKKMNYKVIDISAGGISFLVKDEELGLFQNGMTLKNFSFNLKNRLIQLDKVEVRHVKALPTNSRLQGIKVGVQFEALRPADSNHIAAYVFEESRRYFSRFI